MKNHLPPRPCVSLALAIACFCAPPVLLWADPLYTWSGPATGGAWDESAHWTVTGGPEADRVPVPVGRVGVKLDNTPSDRAVVFSGASAQLANNQKHADWLRDITLTQTSPAANQLTLRKSLKLGNSLVLAAAHGGSARLLLDNSQLPATPAKSNPARKTTPTLTFEMGYAREPDRQLTLKAGGVLDFSGAVYDEGNAAATISRGNVVLDGGDILLRHGVKAGSNASVSYAINGQLSVHAGEVRFGVPIAPSGGPATITDVRLFVGNGLTMTGGRLVNADNQNKTLWLNGASNLILETAAIDPRIQITLGAGGEQTLTSSIPLDGIQLRQSSVATKTIAIHAKGPNVGRISFAQSKADAPATLRLGSDLTLRPGAALPQADPVARPSSGSTVVYEIDTAGHTLDLTANPAPWKPNRPGADITAHWRITGGGVIAATGFDFRSEGITVTVEPGTTLRDATGRTITNP